MINGDWITDAKEIISETFRFFGDRFHETSTVRPALINDNFIQLSPDASSLLERNFDSDIWSCGADKSPGPDGFTFMFLNTSSR